MKLRVVSQRHEPQSIAATNDNSVNLGGGIAQLDYLSLEASRSEASDQDILRRDLPNLLEYRYRSISGFYDTCYVLAI